jgi:hypothetical protein
VARTTLEIADIFRTYGPAWRRANAGHVSLTQLKVMSAIEACLSIGPQLGPWIGSQKGPLFLRHKWSALAGRSWSGLRSPASADRRDGVIRRGS